MKDRKLNILSVGPYSRYGISNTCTHRYEAMAELGYKVDLIDAQVEDMTFFDKIRWHLFRHGMPVRINDRSKVNEKIISGIKNNSYDILWIDKGIHVERRTLEKVRAAQPKCSIAGYSPDDMNQRHNQSRQWLKSLPCYDIYFTTKSYNVDELRKLGCKNVCFIGNAYNHHFHKEINVADKALLGGDVGFIGTYEKERADYMSYLADNGINVRIWGNDWQGKHGLSSKLRIEYRSLNDINYVQAICSFKINLCFLRKINRDLQTTRTMEIPACKAFMMAEKTDEHRELFEEDKEAVFFDSKEELLDKCRYYLEHEEERLSVAENGFIRCKKSGYSNVDRIRQMLKAIQEVN